MPGLLHLAIPVVNAKYRLFNIILIIGQNIRLLHRPVSRFSGHQKFSYVPPSIYSYRRTQEVT